MDTTKLLASCRIKREPMEEVEEPTPDFPPNAKAIKQEIEDADEKEEDAYYRKWVVLGRGHNCKQKWLKRLMQLYDLTYPESIFVEQPVNADNNINMVCLEGEKENPIAGLTFSAFPDQDFSELILIAAQGSGAASAGADTPPENAVAIDSGLAMRKLAVSMLKRHLRASGISNLLVQSTPFHCPFYSELGFSHEVTTRIQHFAKRLAPYTNCRLMECRLNEDTSQLHDGACDEMLSQSRRDPIYKKFLLLPLAPPKPVAQSLVVPVEEKQPQQPSKARPRRSVTLKKEAQPESSIQKADGAGSKEIKPARPSFIAISKILNTLKGSFYATYFMEPNAYKRAFPPGQRSWLQVKEVRTMLTMDHRLAVEEGGGQRYQAFLFDSHFERLFFNFRCNPATRDNEKLMANLDHLEKEYMALRAEHLDQLILEEWNGPCMPLMEFGAKLMRAERRARAAEWGARVVYDFEWDYVVEINHEEEKKEESSEDVEDTEHLLHHQATADAAVEGDIGKEIDSWNTSTESSVEILRKAEDTIELE